MWDNQTVSSRNDIKEYQARWVEVEKIQAEERRSVSFELRWRQLNAVYRLAKGLGWLKPDPSETVIYERWAKLKRIHERQTLKV